MDRLKLCGAVSPLDSFTLHAELEPLTSVLRPSVVVDLDEVTELHPAAVSVLIRHQRQARRQGGNVAVSYPRCDEARRTLERVGLVGAG